MPPAAAGEAGGGSNGALLDIAESIGRGVGSTGTSSGFGSDKPTGRPPSGGSVLGSSPPRFSKSFVRPLPALPISASAAPAPAASPTSPATRP
ncbi:MAG: hypothetical protein WB989_03045, partial [Mycobacterium sp.]